MHLKFEVSEGAVYPFQLLWKWHFLDFFWLPLDFQLEYCCCFQDFFSPYSDLWKRLDLKFFQSKNVFLNKSDFCYFPGICIHLVHCRHYLLDLDNSSKAYIGYSSHLKEYLYIFKEFWKQNWSSFNFSHLSIHCHICKNFDANLW